MNVELTNICEMFANNRDALAKGFVWQNTHMSVVASALLTSGNRAVDLQRMKENFEETYRSFFSFA